MIRYTLIFSALLLTVAALPAIAAIGEPVGRAQLGRYVGSELYGAHGADLGIISSVSTRAGDVSVVGPQGQVLTIGASMLMHNGLMLMAPDLTAAEIAAWTNEGKADTPIRKGHTKAID